MTSDAIAAPDNADADADADGVPSPFIADAEPDKLITTSNRQ